MESKILQLTSELYDELSQREEKDYDLTEFDLTENDIEPYFKEQKSLLLEFIEYKLNNKQKFSIEKCKKFYQELDIPYIVIDYYIKLLKKTLLKEILKLDITKDELLTIEYIFDDMLNLVANIYLKKEINKNRYLTSSKFDKFPLYNVHIDWVKKIFDAILKEDFKFFPNESASNCTFTKMMQYPESLMVCMDATLCGQLELLHKILHNNAEALYRLTIAKEYTQALFVFKEFNENLQKFFSLLKDLYHLTYIDLEKSFFKLVEMLEYSDKNIIVSMIDVQNLKQLNIKYGENKVDNILTTIESFLKERVKEDQEESLVVRAISSNFYLLSLNKEPKKFELEIRSISQDLTNNLNRDFPNCNTSLNIASLEFDKNIKYQKYELIRILLHLKEKSKQNNGFYFAYEQAEKEELQKWLKQHYYNIQYIEEKLNNKMVDIMLQPIYRNNGKEIYAYEALARFKDKNRLIPAGVFIDTVYQIGRISDLDKLVLNAILEKKDWILSTKRKLFINTSPQSLTDSSYLKALNNFIQIYGKNNLLIEITEQQAIESFDALEEIHKAHNIKFAIDDFGSGYSSLKTVVNMINKGLVDVLKIDGSLIANLDKEEESQKIVQIVTQMCKIFKIKALAEFVENKETVELLSHFGTDLLQGYYLSKPLYIEEIIVIN
ncbi:EAL domain-containing protein [Hydrogenimonas thermophila]|uniref:EAL domain, c-di-GMP-specific phosphodiesterase class I (Or its enzymatically inactive variant) n=1 Tax=Hydrogenimonas thermophila TaxID=223786 RepID=A0A1I5SB28_9BACT|nr:EAL domain-containing protein [Hydrogenimonas thermophila]SFP67920.1 EAL domain, c-di-GMP-specific phosphodiesterase class I (or its enzymatically inactive variant) [Hydrogenimonas thermophila]